ncbi:MAG: hypothetical protein WC383_06365 [Gammaproteobacteria bacterium]
MEYARAALASGLAAFLLVVVMSFLSSGGRIYIAEVDWAKANSMNYEEAQKYLVQRSRSITRWESLKNGISYSAFWVSALADWVLYFLVGFVSCVFYRKLSRSDRTPDSAPSSSANLL